MYLLIILLIIIVICILFRNREENFGCGNPNKQCCASGSYGADSYSCTSCPSNKPSSTWNIPDNNCNCPNSNVNACFACNDKCKPFNPLTKVCTAKTCQSGKTCNSRTGNCV